MLSKCYLPITDRLSPNGPDFGELKAPPDPIHPRQPENARPISALPSVPPIHVTPATPDEGTRHIHTIYVPSEELAPIEEQLSPTTEKDASKSKKVQQMLKNRVHKGHARISTISKKIGHGVARTGSLRRSNSAPGQFELISMSEYLVFFFAHDLSVQIFIPSSVPHITRHPRYTHVDSSDLSFSHRTMAYQAGRLHPHRLHPSHLPNKQREGIVGRQGKTGCSAICG